MATTPLNSFAALQQFMTQIVAQNNETAELGTSPHKAFWSDMTYDQFTSGNIPKVFDPKGNPMPILVKGHSAQSNLIMALQGTGPIFGPTGAYDQMPPKGPKFTSDQINSIANWIDAGCPE
jgi:hypothetical protein